MHYGWSDNDTLKAEKKLLDAMMMTGGFKLEDVPLAGDATMHTIRTGANAARDCKQAPILLIHGYAGGSALWAPLMARMVQDIRDRQIFAIDLPGVGLSRDKNGIRWSKGRAFLVGFGRSASGMDYYINAIRLWMRAKQLGKVVLVGHSFGALIAAQFCRSYPDLVQKLVLLSPVGLIAPEPGKVNTGRRRDSKAKNVPDRIVAWLWKTHQVPPTAIARKTGIFLPAITKAVMSKSFALDGLTVEQRRWLYKYEHGLICKPSSADYCMPFYISALGEARMWDPNLLPDLSPPGGVYVLRGTEDWAPSVAGSLPRHFVYEELPNGSHSMHIEVLEQVWESLRRLVFHDCK